MVDAVIGAAVLASVHDSRWFLRKTAPRKQIGTSRPCKALSLSLCRWMCPKMATGGYNALSMALQHRGTLPRTG
jgi:hypothetical protein